VHKLIEPILARPGGTSAASTWFVIGFGFGSPRECVIAPSAISSDAARLFTRPSVAGKRPRPAKRIGDTYVFFCESYFHQLPFSLQYLSSITSKLFRNKNWFRDKTLLLKDLLLQHNAVIL
jgi:hypothetical protein